MRLLLLIGRGVIWAALVSGGGSAMADNTNAILIDCQVGSQASEDMLAPLCDALESAIVQHAASRPVLRTPPQHALPDGALHITLHLDRAEDTFLIAHLSWDVSGKSDVTVEPEVELSVSDSTISPTMLPNLVSSLLKVSTLPL